MKKLNVLAAVIAASASLVAVNANAYQAEVGATMNVVSPEKGKNATGFGVDGTYHFAPVQDNQSQPLAEQAFLQNSSNIHAGTSFAKMGEVKTTVVNAGATYYVPGTQFAGMLDAGHSNFKDSTDDSVKINVVRAGVGYKPSNDLLLQGGIAYSQVKTEVKNDTSYASSSVSNTSPYIGAKYLTKVGANDLNLEANATLGDNKVVSLGADYYFDRTFSVGTGYSANHPDVGSSTDAFSFRAKKFFTPEMSLEGTASFGDDNKTYVVRGAYRF
ncbi:MULTISPECIES: putative porin [unclassified Acinetobacter]|uniref:putative porin n=1 Tax=unclassified Acinetobacter TaxID=196816 RepID=UPI0035B6FB8E